MKTEDDFDGAKEAGLMANGRDQMANGKGAGAEQCVPLEALGVPGEDDKLNNPEVGDPVSYTVEGKVSRVEGGMAYVTPQAVNGKPVSEEAAKTTDEPGEQERKELYDMAEARDQAGGGMPGGMGGMA